MLNVIWFMFTYEWCDGKLIKNHVIQSFHYTAKGSVPKMPFLYLFAQFFYVGHNETSIIFTKNKHIDLSSILSLCFCLCLYSAVPSLHFINNNNNKSNVKVCALHTALELKSLNIHLYFDMLYISLTSAIRKFAQMRNSTLFSQRNFIRAMKRKMAKEKESRRNEEQQIERKKQNDFECGWLHRTRKRKSN